MTYSDVPKADVWAFGFPCQDLSIAGAKNGMKLKCQDCTHIWEIEPEEYDGNNRCPECGGTNVKSESRSGCFFEMMRLLKETEENAPENMPSVIIAENVKGLKPYLNVLEIEYKKRGYIAHYQLFNSKYWNVAQSRERYAVVGTRECENLTFSFPTEQHDFIPKLSDFLDESVDEKYYIADSKAKTIIQQALERLASLGKVHATLTPDREKKRQRGPRAKAEEEPMFTLTAQDLHGVIQAADEMALESEICKESGLLDPNGCGKTLRVGGGRKPRQETQLSTSFDETMTNTLFTDKDNCAYCCQASYYKGLSPCKIGKGQRTHIIERIGDKENG